MRIDQFDRLQVLVREIREKVLQLRQANYRLNEENEKLVGKIAIYEQNSENNEPFDVLKIKDENKQLKQKNNQAMKRLEDLIGFVESNVA